MPAAAMAQGNPGPFGGLFGRSAARSGENRSIVEVRSSVGGQYDSALLDPEDASTTPTRDGYGTGATAGLFLEHASPKVTAFVSGEASRLQYFTTPNYGVNLFKSTAALSTAITTRIRVEAEASYLHSPFFSLYQDFGRNNSVDGDSAVLPFAPYATQLLDNEAVQASIGLSVPLTDRSRVSASANRRQTLFADSDADLVADGYRASWDWQIQRGFGVHASYGREHEDQRGAQARDYDQEIIDVGVNFNRALSLARRTTLAFATSSSIIKEPSGQRQFRVNGNVVLMKFFRRTWRASAYASRDTSFVPGFFEPLFSDTAGVSLGGLFTKRIEWTMNAAGGLGQAGFSDNKGFKTMTASTRLSVALNRHLGLFGQYVAYGYELPKNSNALGLSDRLARHAVSVGLTTYIPVYNKTRQ